MVEWSSIYVEIFGDFFPIHEEGVVYVKYTSYFISSYICIFLKKKEGLFTFYNNLKILLMIV